MHVQAVIYTGFLYRFVSHVSNEGVFPEETKRSVQQLDADVNTLHHMSTTVTQVDPATPSRGLLMQQNYAHRKYSFCAHWWGKVLKLQRVTNIQVREYHSCGSVLCQTQQHPKRLQLTTERNTVHGCYLETAQATVVGSTTVTTLLFVSKPLHVQADINDNAQSCLVGQDLQWLLQQANSLPSLL